MSLLSHLPEALGIALAASSVRMVAGTAGGLCSLAAMAVYALMNEARMPLLLPGAALFMASIFLRIGTSTRRWLLPFTAAAVFGLLLVGGSREFSQGWSVIDGALASPVAFWLTTGLRSRDSMAINLTALPLALLLADRLSGRLLLMACLAVLLSLLMESYRKKRIV